MQVIFSMQKVTTSRGLGIGAVSEQSGINVETIRYYERIGLLPPPDRTPGGNRQYDGKLLERLFFIKRCRELGFSISEIRVLLSMADRRDFTCEEVREITAAHLENVRGKIDKLRRLEKVLQSMVAECNKGELPECPVIEALRETA